MEKKKVYIGGKITGEDYQQCLRKFNATEEILSGIGFEVTNPMSIIPKDTPWEKAMELLRPHLLNADYLFLLPDWKLSKGTCIEVELAEAYGIETILYSQITEMQWS